MENLRIAMGCSGCFVVDPIGLQGGLALLWKAVVQVSILLFPPIL